jgi:hypothetical protein
MRYVMIFLLFFAVLFCIGCPEKPTDQPDNGEVKPFTPPEDGRISVTQQKSYIKASLALQTAMEKYSDMIKEFVDKYKLKQDLSQMSDTVFLNSKPEIKKEWEVLNKKWDEMQKEAYKTAEISEEEFNWIGGALTDEINAAVQKEVEKALTPEKENE